MTPAEVREIEFAIAEIFGILREADETIRGGRAVDAKDLNVKIERLCHRLSTMPREDALTYAEMLTTIAARCDRLRLDLEAQHEKFTRILRDLAPNKNVTAEHG